MYGARMHFTTLRKSNEKDDTFQNFKLTIVNKNAVK